MSVFSHTNGKIHIDGYMFDLNVMTAFDPEYSLPNGCISRHYIQEKKGMRN